MHTDASCWFIMGNAMGLALTAGSAEIVQTQHNGSFVFQQLRSQATEVRRRLRMSHMKDQFMSWQDQISLANERGSLIGLMGCPIHLHDVDVLVSRIRPEMLSCLMMSYNEMTAEVVDALLKHLDRCDKLVELEISNNAIGDAGLQSLGTTLVGNSTLQKVVLTNNAVTSKGVARFAQTCLRSNTTLQNLGLRSNGVGGTGLRELCNALVEVAADRPLSRTKSLHTLDLRGCELTESDGEALKDLLSSNAYVEDLTVGGNMLGDEGLRLIAEGLQRNATLKALKIAANDITDAGVQFLVRALEVNSMLEVLLLHANGSLTDASADALAAAIVANLKCRLKVVATFATQITQAGQRTIKVAIKAARDRLRETKTSDSQPRLGITQQVIPPEVHDLWTANIRQFLLYKCNASEEAFQARSKLVAAQKKLFAAWASADEDFDSQTKRHEQLFAILSEMKSVASAEQARLLRFANELFFVIIQERLRGELTILNNTVRLEKGVREWQTLSTPAVCVGPWVEEAALNELHIKASWTNAEFHRAMRSLVDLFNRTDTIEDYGIDQEIFGKQLKRWDPGDGSSHKVFVVYDEGPLKRMDRCRSKLAEYTAETEENRRFPYPRASRIQDIVRGQVRASSPYTLAVFFAFLRRCEDNDPPMIIGDVFELPPNCKMQVTRVKNGFNSSDGNVQYRCAIVNVCYKGHICELQLALSDLYSIKKQMHMFYNVERSHSWSGLLNKPMGRLRPKISVVFLLGPQGAGKSSAANIICSKFGLGFVGIGDLVRREKAKQPKTKLGALFDENTEKGQLQPSHIIFRMLLNQMQMHPECTTFIVDGFPRDVTSVEQWKNQASSCEAILAVVLEANFEQRLQRIMQRNRNKYDTDIEHQRKREALHQENSSKVLAALQSELGLRIAKIDASHDLDHTVLLFERVLANVK